MSFARRACPPWLHATITFIVGGLYLKETKHVRIWEELEASRTHSLEREG